MFEYDTVNRWVFIRLRKVSRDGADVTSGGRLFQTWGPATGKALSPTVDRLDCGWVHSSSLTLRPKLVLYLVEFKACVPKLCVLLYSVVLSCVAACLMCHCSKYCQLDFNEDLSSNFLATIYRSEQTGGVCSKRFHTWPDRWWRHAGVMACRFTSNENSKDFRSDGTEELTRLDETRSTSRLTQHKLALRRWRADRLWHPRPIGLTSYGALGHVPPLGLAYVHQFGNVYLHISPVGSDRLVVNTRHFYVSTTDSQSFNPLERKCNYSATLNNIKLIHWVCCCIWYSEEKTGQGRSPPRPLLAVPNVTGHPSTVSVYQSAYSCITVRCSAVLMCPLKG